MGARRIVVGQYKSYKDLQVEREVARLEEELIKLKTSQRYGVGRVSSFQSNLLAQDAIHYRTLTETFSGTTYTTYLSGTNLIRVRFASDIQSKAVHARLDIHFQNISSSTQYIDFRYIKRIPGPEPGIIDWWLWFNSWATNTYPPSWTANIYALTSAPGLLTLEEALSVSNNYEWLSGSYYGE